MDRGWRLAAALAAAVLVPGHAVALDPPQPEIIALRFVSGASETKPGESLPQGWQKWTLSRFKKSTQYELVVEAGTTVLRATARASASGLVHPLRLDPRAYSLLSWRWKATGLIAKADNTQKHTEDSPVRVAVSFDGDIDKLPRDDRRFFDNIRLLGGHPLPYATLMYIWENRVTGDTVIPNLHTSRIKMVVAESGPGKVGRWQEVTRNVYKDFKRAFGEEPGTIISVGIMTDTDNTGESIQAYYGDIVFRRVQPR